MIKPLKAADKMWVSFLAFINLALFPFDITELRHIFHPSKAHGARGREELNIASLGREKTVVFLNISDTDRSLDPLVNLFYTQALQTLVTEADKQENGQLPDHFR